MKMTIKRIVSLKWRIDRIIRAYNKQTFENGQHYLTGEQLSQLYHIKEIARIGKVLCPRGRNTWSVHNMVNIQNYLDAQVLSLQLGCLYD